MMRLPEAYGASGILRVKRTRWDLIAATGLLLLALAPRLLVASGGWFVLDLHSWGAWTHALVSGSPRTFYQRSGSDYLPGYLYILLALGHLAPYLQHLPSPLVAWLLHNHVLFKLPAIIADVATVQVLYWSGRAWVDRRVALIAAAVYALNPGVLANSARWGQVDSIAAATMLLALVLCIERRDGLCGIALALSVITKPTACVLLPLLGVVLVCSHRFTGLVRCTITFVLTGLLLVLPFVPADSTVLQFLRFAIGNTAGRHPFVTDNAFNLWAIYQSVQGPDAPLALDSRTLLHLSFSLWSWILLMVIMLIVLAVTAWRVLRAPSQRPLLLLPAAGVLALAFFVVLTRMHERHLLPALPLLALTCVVWPQFWGAYIWLSVAYLLNIWFSDQALLPGRFPMAGSVEIPLVSLLNVVTLVLSVLMLVTAFRAVPGDSTSTAAS